MRPLLGRRRRFRWLTAASGRQRRRQRRGDVDIAHWIVATANALKVTAVALKWRLVNLKMVPEAIVRRLITIQGDMLAATPLLFSLAFVERVYHAVEAGRLSLRRAASLLDLSLDAFAGLCRSYGRPLSYDAPVQA